MSAVLSPQPAEPTSPATSPGATHAPRFATLHELVNEGGSCEYWRGWAASSPSLPWHPCTPGSGTQRSLQVDSGPAGKLSLEGAGGRLSPTRPLQEGLGQRHNGGKLLGLLGTLPLTPDGWTGLLDAARTIPPRQRRCDRLRLWLRQRTERGRSSCPPGSPWGGYRCWPAVGWSASALLTASPSSWLTWLAGIPTSWGQDTGGISHGPPRPPKPCRENSREPRARHVAESFRQTGCRPQAFCEWETSQSNGFRVAQSPRTRGAVSACGFGDGSARGPGPGRRSPPSPCAFWGRVAVYGATVWLWKTSLLQKVSNLQEA